MVTGRDPNSPRKPGDPIDPGAGAQMPPDWTPERDRDPRWRGIASLLREADTPRMPSEEEYEAIRDLVYEEYLAALPPSAPAKRESFLEWLRVVLVEGGFGAQAVRLAAAAAIALLIGLQFVPRQEGVQVAQGDERPALSQGQMTSIIDAVERTIDSRIRTALPDDSPMREVVSVPNGMMPTPTPSVFNYPGLSEESSSAAALPVYDVEAPGWARTVPPEYALSFQKGFQTVGAADTVTAPPAVPADREFDPDKQEILDLVQQLKFHSILYRDESGLKQIQRLERALTSLLESGDLPKSEIAAWESFRSGEDLVERQRYTDALLAFHEARTMVPGTFLGFLAQFQIARIEYEHLRDYEAALEAYRVCLEEYPSHFLTDQHKSHILERVEMLARNKSNGWEAIRLWQDAQDASDSSTRAARLVELLESAPQSTLSGLAAMSLASLVIDTPFEGEPEPARLVELLEEAKQAAPGYPDPCKAQIQYAKAEILNRKLFAFQQAESAYREVRTLSGGGDNLDKLVRIRLLQLKGKR